MENGKKKLKNLIRNKKIVIPSIIVIILLIILIIIGTKGKKNLNTVRLENQSMYQYLDNVKVTYDTTLTLESDNNITKMEIGDKSEVVNNLPLYYSGEDVVLFPTAMSLVFPLSNYTQKKVPALTILDGQSSLYKTLKYKNNTYDLENAFLYDGNDLYFFIEPTTLVLDDKEINLQPLSFVLYNNLTGYASYYNYGEGSEMVLVKKDCLAKTSNYTLNLKIDGIASGSDYKLLAKNLDILNNLF